MYKEQLRNAFRFAVCALLGALLLNGFALLAQGGIPNLRVASVSRSSAYLTWDAVAGASYYDIYVVTPSGNEHHAGGTSGTSYNVRRLRSNTTYTFRVYASNGSSGSVSASTKREVKIRRYVPPPVTCPHLPAYVVVTGYKLNTQCQIVDEAGVGQMDVIKRGVIAAVNIWNYVSNPIDVCIRGHGWMVLLDAAYPTRQNLELAHTHRDGMTCSVTDRAGTVALVASAPPPHTTYVQLPLQSEEEAEPEPETVSLPTFEAISLDDCFIKLMDSLFLRETPGGAIIGIVWLNSEVHASEINGYWYKVEFEGKTGYISRYHRKVLQGGCG